LRQKKKRAAMNDDYMMQILKCLCQAWLRCSYPGWRWLISFTVIVQFVLAKTKDFLANSDLRDRLRVAMIRHPEFR
jgi:hypothetical protein